MGLFNISEDHIQSELSLDQRFLPNKSTSFFFKMSSNCMNPNIQKDDVLVVDRSMHPFSGNLIVFSLNGEMLCKRYFRRGVHTYLQSDHGSYKDIIIKSTDDFIIFGVVASMLRERP